MSKLKDIWLVIIGELSTAHILDLKTQKAIACNQAAASLRGWENAKQRVAQLEKIHDPMFNAEDSAKVGEWAIEKMRLNAEIDRLRAKLLGED